MEAKSVNSTREQLLLAGMEELQEFGIDGFSTRRVAKVCGLSCAAPYKHFKDTHQFIEEIFSYVEQQFLREREQVLQRFSDESLRCRLVEVSLCYICFLTEHPDFRSVVLLLTRRQRGVSLPLRTDEPYVLPTDEGILSGGADAGGCAAAQDLFGALHHLQRTHALHQRGAGI